MRALIGAAVLLLAAACGENPPVLAPAPPASTEERGVDRPSEVLPPQPKDVEERDHGGVPLPPLDEPSELADTEKDLPVQKDMTSSSTIDTAIAFLRRPASDSVLGSATIARAETGSRVTLELTADRGRYAVELTHEAETCEGGGDRGFEQLGSITIPRARARSQMSFVLPVAAGDVAELDGRALRLRALPSRVIIACGRIAVFRADPRR